MIIFPIFLDLDLLLKLSNLRKLQLTIIPKFLSVLFCSNYRTLLGIQHCLERIPLSNFNKHAPLRTLSKRKSKQPATPWIPKRLRRTIKIKNKLLYSGDRKRYKLYRNKVLLLFLFRKRSYCYTYFEGNINNIEKTWEGINILINRKKKSASDNYQFK